MYFTILTWDLNVNVKPNLAGNIYFVIHKSMFKSQGCDLSRIFLEGVKLTVIKEGVH